MDIHFLVLSLSFSAMMYGMTILLTTQSIGHALCLGPLLKRFLLAPEVPSLTPSKLQEILVSRFNVPWDLPIYICLIDYTKST